LLLIVVAVAAVLAVDCIFSYPSKAHKISNSTPKKDIKINMMFKSSLPIAAALLLLQGGNADNVPPLRLGDAKTAPISSRVLTSKPSIMECTGDTCVCADRQTATEMDAVDLSCPWDGKGTPNIPTLIGGRKVAAEFFDDATYITKLCFLIDLFSIFAFSCVTDPVTSYTSVSVVLAYKDPDSEEIQLFSYGDDEIPDCDDVEYPGCYDCEDHDPCNPLETEDEFYYTHCDADKFVQCSEYGECFVQDCPVGLVWGADVRACVEP